jgi:hypothetical protein
MLRGADSVCTKAGPIGPTRAILNIRNMASVWAILLQREGAHLFHRRALGRVCTLVYPFDEPIVAVGYLTCCFVTSPWHLAFKNIIICELAVHVACALSEVHDLSQQGDKERGPRPSAQPATVKLDHVHLKQYNNASRRSDKFDLVAPSVPVLRSTSESESLDSLRSESRLHSSKFTTHTKQSYSSIALELSQNMCRWLIRVSHHDASAFGARSCPARHDDRTQWIAPRYSLSLWPCRAR